ncbi:nuclear transport factor 2 family protein [Spongisporangium articulatum]|uniref:Nuclear transport factor 2 family protein n=1 Tax=Spongisporangium articulatum TaxID=3362603 RepID=A0ABW8ATN9_9ACTN
MGFRRRDIEALWRRWLSANRTAEAERDWAPLADFYAPDATYGWMYTPDEHFMAVGREEIRRYALGTEMAGLDGWHYDYQATVTDDVAGMVIGFWKQRAGILDDEGREYEITGIGGSWFGLGENAHGALEFAWQRDWFDLGSTAHTFLAIVASGRAPQGLVDRMSLDGKSQPGHYTLKDLPSSVWPPPVEAGAHVTRELS